MLCICQLMRLQEENDTLIGKHSTHSQLMQEESIDLPNNIEVCLSDTLDVTYYFLYACVAM